MRANGDATFTGCEQRCVHHARISRMKTAGDVCGSDEREQFVIVARAFAKIGVEIDAQFHFVRKARPARNLSRSRSRSMKRRCASPNDTSAKRTASPGCNWAAAARSTV